MPGLSLSKPITAIVYSETGEIHSMMQAIADHLIDRGLALAGFVQRNLPCPGRVRCDMILEELSTGERFGISEDRGPAARGCMLDGDELMKAVASAARALDAGPDLLIVNKFGKTESEGGGFRELIAEALSRGVPILIAVPCRNLDGWRLFAGEYAVEHRIEMLARDVAVACAQLGYEAAPNPVGAQLVAS